jgi:hypothetical protein
VALLFLPELPLTAQAASAPPAPPAEYTSRPWARSRRPCGDCTRW